MPKEQDSIQIQTVIAYPKKKLQKNNVVSVIAHERKGLEGRDLPPSSNDMIFIGAVSLASLLLFTCYLQIKKIPTKPQFLSYFFQSPEQESIHDTPVVNVLQHLLAFVVSFSLSYFFIKDFFHLPNWQIGLYTAGILIGYIAIRSVLIFLTGYFVQDFTLSKNHHRTIRSFNKQMGLLLFPILFVSLFLTSKTYPIILGTALLIFILKILAQTFFVYKLLRVRKFSFSHSFLYLCTLEILPPVYMALLAGYLMNNN